MIEFHSGVYVLIQSAASGVWKAGLSYSAFWLFFTHQGENVFKKKEKIYLF